MNFDQALDTEIEKLKELNKNKDDYVLGIVADNKHIVIDMNTEDQLFVRGVNSKGVPISDYAPYHPITLQKKREKGQPTDRVTLRDTEAFHGGFTLNRNRNEIQISSRDQKTLDLTKKYGKDIFGLIDENIDEISIYYVQPELLKLIKP